MKKYLVLVFAIFLLAGNAYAVRYDATGEWNITVDFTFTPYPGAPAVPNTGTRYRTWDIVDNLQDNTFELEYIFPIWSFTVNGNYDEIKNTYDITSPFTYLRPDNTLQRIESFSFCLTTPTSLEGESLTFHSIPVDTGWSEVGTLACNYTGSPVPEPATMLLLGSGLVGLAGFGRKKFKK
jgi:hypothetical protein